MTYLVDMYSAYMRLDILFREPYGGPGLERTTEPIGGMPNLQRLQILLHPGTDRATRIIHELRVRFLRFPSNPDEEGSATLGNDIP
jgi:hypothetical protein